ncbi:MAG TPA: UDP-N-acetylmuramate dehydrogenase [Acidimicrobiales bacterium]|nr:UDP-N-acetylmuramate dehydrogenase [Acidimicrobiales bacterium]
MTANPVDAVAKVLGPRARSNVALGPFTTYRVGGPAALLLEARDGNDLALAQKAVSGSGVEVLVVGRGSNLLVSDGGFQGLAIVLGDGFAAIRLDGTDVEAGAAVSLPVLARRTAAAGLAGLEWAVGVPGSVGGAVRMNAGGHGSDIRAVLRSVQLLDLSTASEPARTIRAADLDLQYRRSAVRSHQIVTAAQFELRPGVREAAEAEIAEIVRWRRANQPGGANSGSVFTNPPGDSAGRLIDASGLKGLRVGSATVSPRHANFFQVDDGGSADDVVALMKEVARVVLERTGVELTPEVHVVGSISPSTGG